jgi:hypothetical protein
MLNVQAYIKKLEDEMEHLKEVNNYLKNKTNILEKDNSKLSRQNANILQKNTELSSKNALLIQDQAKLSNQRTRASNFFELSARQKRNVSKKIRANTKGLEAYMNTYNIKIGSLNVVENFNDGNYKINYFNSVTVAAHSLLYHLYVKDAKNISDDAYEVVRSQIARQWPVIGKIKSYRKNINADLDERVKTNSKGYYLDVRHIISRQIKDFIQNYGFKKRKYKVKISADSTNVGRKLKILNVTLALVDDIKNCMSQHGHEIIGMFQIKEENYDEVKTCLHEIFAQIEEIGNQVHINNDIYKVDFYFVSDWKMLAIVTGLNGANSNFSCIWCICHKDEFAIKKFCLHRTWPGCPDKGRLHRSLLPSNIPLNNVLIDTLHLFMRITEQLLNKVLKECKNADGISKKQRFTPIVNKHCTEFIRFMNANKIHYNLFSTKKSAIQGNSLTGRQLMKFIENIDVIKILPNYKHKFRLQKLIDDFHLIYRDLKEEKMSSSEIQKRTGYWIRNACIVFNGKATPYMHIFHRHLCTQAKKNGSIYRFNLEGLEKQNDVTTKAYFRSSNFRCKAVRQVFVRFLRIKHAEELLKVRIASF